ncbi:hypothetical protein FRC14_002308 [Serendipita sp. 396]|nr:hypothetical protein FRC14_002308 [Serendipita sp. 396]KAG8800525.1 hypothetical protein FRC16_002714 [Serendipita sp. 398]KAG8834210.1 hypothetical protein FRC18_002366 [Serendipita sp. 400]
MPKKRLFTPGPGEVPTSPTHDKSLEQMSTLELAAAHTDTDAKYNKVPLNLGEPETMDVQIYSSLPLPLQQLLKLIRDSSFCAHNALEPTIGSSEGRGLLSQIDEFHSSSSLHRAKKSIYYLFTDESTKRCQLCGTMRSTNQRVITCVRRHLNHSPFTCLGAPQGCKLCDDKKGTLFYVHMKGVSPSYVESRSSNIGLQNI